MRLHMAGLVLLFCLSVSHALPSSTHTRSSPFLPFPGLRRVSSGFFSTDPLNSVRRSIQDIQEGVGRSMKSLMAVGSAIGHRMLGMITRAPRLLSSAPVLFSSPQIHDPSPLPSHPAPTLHRPPPAPFPNFEDCDCHFGTANLPPPKFLPISDNTLGGSSYGSPAEESYGSPVEETYGSPVEESYGSPQAPAIETYGSPIAPPVADGTYSSPEGGYSSPEDAYSSPVLLHDPSEDGLPLSPPVVAAAPNILESTYGSPGDSYHSPSPRPSPVYSPPAPLALSEGVADPSDNSIHDLSVADKPHEAVIHPGGGDLDGAPSLHGHHGVVHQGEHLDVHNLEVLGAASVVQAPSAQVPDQSHPEKYMNFDTEWLDMVVHNNLWYKNTKAFKHHHHGEKKKVIPHLHPGRV